MSNKFGYYIPDNGVICGECHSYFMTMPDITDEEYSVLFFAEAVGKDSLPDGFTCDSCCEVRS